MSCRSNRPNAAPVPLRNSSTMMSIAFAEPRHDRGARLHARLAVVVEQHVGVRVRQREPTLVGGLGRRRRPRRTPATACCSSHSCAYRSAMPAGCGQLAGRHRTGAGQRLVEPEPDAQLDVGELHRRQARHEQVAGELLDLAPRPSPVSSIVDIASSFRRADQPSSASSCSHTRPPLTDRLAPPSASPHPSPSRRKDPAATSNEHPAPPIDSGALGLSTSRQSYETSSSQPRTSPP